MDQAVNGYFSHYGLDGSTRETRLRRGGVSFGWSGENQCYLVGRSQQSTLDWCHAQFMAEPYPGQWNHIANILNPNARRMGVGIAEVGEQDRHRLGLRRLSRARRVATGGVGRPLQTAFRHPRAAIVRSAGSAGGPVLHSLTE